MKGIFAVAGSDILSINGTVISGHADADAYQIEPQGSIGEMKVSKDGNSIYAAQYTGKKAKVTVRIVRGCADDILLNGLVQSWLSAPNVFSLMNGEYVKSTGDGGGDVINGIYMLSGGIPEKIPEAKSNMDGNTEQSVVVYTFLFRIDAVLMS